MKNTSSPAGRLHEEVDCRPARSEKLHGPTIKATTSPTSRLHGGVDCGPGHSERQHGPTIKNKKHNHLMQQAGSWRNRLPAGPSRETTWARGQKQNTSPAGLLLGEIDCRSVHPERRRGPTINKRASSPTSLLHGEVDCRPVCPERQHGPTIKNTHHHDQAGSMEK